MIKLSLVTFASLPYPSAEGVHMTMMANAFCNVVDFELISPFKIWRPKTISTNLMLFGDGLDTIKHKKFLQLKPKQTFFLNSILSNDKERVYYCRQTYGANFFLKKKRRVILELHGLPSNDEFAFLKNVFMMTEFIGLVVITESLKIDILSFLGDEYNDKIHVLPDAADVDRFHYRPLGKKSAMLKIGYVGSNYPGKGWEIIEKLPGVCDNDFHIYGFLHENNSFLNVTFYGKIPYSKIPKALNSFDVGLLPNQPNVIMAGGDDIGKYTSPMKLFEYMASGKVIVASNLPVIREILKDNHNALLVPHNDINEWKEAITKLNNNKDLYLKLQEQAYQDVCNLYSYKGRVNKILKLIGN